jgi:hypothetical protein
VRAVRDTAHALRSSAAYLGASGIQRVASELCSADRRLLEKHGQAKLEELNEALERFRTGVTRFLEEHRRSGHA